jgi:hypothetical protein
MTNKPIESRDFSLFQNVQKVYETRQPLSE